MTDAALAVIEARLARARPWHWRRTRADARTLVGLLRCERAEYERMYRVMCEAKSIWEQLVAQRRAG